jgi:hypothetical protein
MNPPNQTMQPNRWPADEQAFHDSISTISEKPIAFVELKVSRCQKNDLASAGSSEQKAAQILVFCILGQTLRTCRNISMMK